MLPLKALPLKLLTEMPWLGITGGITIPTSTGREVEIDFIDVRIEEMIRDGLVPHTALRGWYAVLPSSGLVLTDRGVGRPDEDKLRGLIRLPDNWWEYSYGLLDEVNVKASRKPRTEQGEKSQEELDRAQVPNESLERRLERALCRDFH